MSHEILPVLIAVYGLASLISAFVSLVFWLKERIMLFRDLALVWVCLVGTSIIQAPVQSGNLAVSLAYATGIPAMALTANLLCKLAGLKFSWKQTTIIAALGIAGTVVAGLIDQPFTIVALPVAFAVALPPLIASIRVLRSPAASCTKLGVRVLAWLVLVMAIHCLDYPFLRMKLDFAPYGFSIGMLQILMLAIIAPLTIIENQRDHLIIMMDEFLSLASHEFKNPLTAAQLQVELLSREAGLADNDKIKKICGNVDRHIGHLTRLTQHLLNVSHIRSGRLKINRKPTDLTALVTEVIERFDNAPISFDCKTPVLGHWDALMIDQVVTNLVSNALKYGDRKPVTVTLTANAGVAELSVKDPGIGIDPVNHERIFQPYERASNAQGFPGLGLGLYIVRQIIQAHGGRIELKSAVNAGTTVIVHLPMQLAT